MEDPRIHCLKKCCFCVPLRVGLLALAYFNFIYSVLSLYAVESVGGAMFVNLVNTVAWVFNDSMPALWILLLFVIVDVASGLVLIYALHKDDPMVLYAYMWYTVIRCLITIYIYVVAMIYIYPVIFYCVALAVSILYQMYIFALVRSFRIEIIQKEEMERNKLSIYKHQEHRDSIEVTVESLPLPTAPPGQIDSTADEKTSL